MRSLFLEYALIAIAGIGVLWIIIEYWPYGGC